MKYLLTMRVQIEADDDADARMQAQSYRYHVFNNQPLHLMPIFKLQKPIHGQPPKSIKLSLTSEDGK